MQTPKVSCELDRRFCVAPMMDWTDRHCRHFHRLISKHAILYTEMVTTGAIIHGDRHRFLRFDPMEQPVALQLGGSDPKDLAFAAREGESYGYAEINLNVGCPSDRVQSGAFGAALMARPELVAECIATMMDAVSIPITVKCRIGIDDQDEDADFQNFIQQVAAAGCSTFIVHARKAWLKGLSPKENRDIPPLNYERVFRLKQVRPDLEIILNGGLKDHATCQQALEAGMDGVMVGREAYSNPWMLSEVDALYYQQDKINTPRADILSQMADYAEGPLSEGAPLNAITRHMLGLYNGLPGARAYRRHMSEGVRKRADGSMPSPQIMRDLAAQMQTSVEESRQG